MIKKYINTNIEKVFLLFAIIVLFFALFLAKSASEDSASQDSNPRLELEDIFQKADIIADGKIDKGEFDIYHYSLFKMFDFDENGWVEKDECLTDCFSYRAWMGRSAEKAKLYRKHEFEKTPYRFDAIDMNTSGDIELFEYIMFGRERFPYFDKDKNGTIELEEFCDAYSVSMPCDFTTEYLQELKQKEQKNEENIIGD